MATELSEELQIPPPELVSVEVAPSQTAAEPEIADGNAFTASTLIALQPIPDVKVIVVVPELTPDTTPEPVPMVATPVLLLDHIPPPEDDSVAELPIQIEPAPEIVPAEVLTVAVNVTAEPQPVV